MSASEHLGAQFPRYKYFEGCGYESEHFSAPDDDAAVAHAKAKFRHPSNVDFDGDEGGVARLHVDPEDGSEWHEVVAEFPGTNMIHDPLGERRSYRGPGRPE